MSYFVTNLINIDIIDSPPVSSKKIRKNSIQIMDMETYSFSFVFMAYVYKSQGTVSPFLAALNGYS